MAVSQLRNRSRSSRADQGREGPAFLDDLLAMAGSLVNSRKDHASSQIEDLADSMRQFSDALPSLPIVKAYAEATADSLEDLAGYVLESDLPDIIADARQLARRHPLLTFGGSVVAGLVLTQLMQTRAESIRAARQVRGQRRRGRENVDTGASDADEAA